MTRLVAAAAIASCVAMPAVPAAAADLPAALFPATGHAWHVDFDGRGPAAVSASHLPAPVFEANPGEPAPLEVTGNRLDTQGAPPPQAFVYSDGYTLRRKIHKYASWATVPLFVAQAIVGQKLYNGSGSGSLKSTHSALAAGTGVLFGINTVTGAWNLWEGRKDPNGRTRRIVHSVLMLAADAAFVATAGTAPESDHGEVSSTRSTHRSAAIVGFSSASVAYALMLLGR